MKRDVLIRSIGNIFLRTCLACGRFSFGLWLRHRLFGLLLYFNLRLLKLKIIFVDICLIILRLIVESIKRKLIFLLVLFSLVSLVRSLFFVQRKLFFLVSLILVGCVVL